jgi:hypothetical protein
MTSGQNVKSPGFANNRQNLLCRDAPQVSIARRKRLVQPVSMTNANTLERWRPHPLIYFNCSLAIVLLGGACSWGIVLLIARCCQPESAVKTAIAGVGLFVVVLWLSLRRCSAPALPAFRGLLLITGYMTIGMGSFSLLFVIPAVVFATVAIIAIALVSLLRNDTAYARKQFQHLVEFYRKHRMYQ